jgi:hypothetical protein
MDGASRHLVRFRADAYQQPSAVIAWAANIDFTPGQPINPPGSATADARTDRAGRVTLRFTEEKPAEVTTGSAESSGRLSLVAARLPSESTYRDRERRGRAGRISPNLTAVPPASAPRRKLALREISVKAEGYDL